VINEKMSEKIKIQHLPFGLTNKPLHEMIYLTDKTEVLSQADNAS
jgi:hypothetical protein